MAYDNNNSGALFRAKEKTRECSPDYTGSANVGGVEYRVSGWIKKSKAGTSYMSLAFSIGRAKGDSYEG